MVSRWHLKASISSTCSKTKTISSGPSKMTFPISWCQSQPEHHPTKNPWNHHEITQKSPWNHPKIPINLHEIPWNHPKNPYKSTKTMVIWYRMHCLVPSAPSDVLLLLWFRELWCNDFCRSACATQELKQTVIPTERYFDILCCITFWTNSSHMFSGMFSDFVIFVPLISSS
jgi:hypothetical protein